MYLFVYRSKNPNGKFFDGFIVFYANKSNFFNECKADVLQLFLRK